MIRYTLTVAALIASAMSVLAGPAEFFSEKEKDFGTVSRGTQQIHYFQVKNNSSETWVIGSVGVSCGCTSASAAQSTIKPGETTTITAIMNTRVFSGFRQVTVHVNFVAPHPAYVGLLVKAVSRDDFMVFPDTLSFGQIASGKEAAARSQLSLTTDPNWTIQSATCESSFVKPEFKLVKRQGFEVVYEVTASVSKDLPVGKWFTDVTLTTSNAGLSRVRIPLTIEVTAPQAPVAVSPAQISFGEVKMGAQNEQKVLVRGEKPFRITAIEKGDGQVEVDAGTKESATTHIVTLKLSATKTGELMSRIKINTDANSSFSIEIPVKAIIKE